MAKMNVLQISAEKRSALGSSASRRIRRSGMVPAVLYGHGMAAESLALPLDAAEKILHHPGMMDVNIEGEGTTSAILKDMQRNAISGQILHIDFLMVKADELIRSSVPIQPRGEPAGAAHGGQLEQGLHELEIECLPGNLPEFIEIDVTPLEVDQSLHVGDLTLPEGIKAVSDETLSVFQVRLPRVEEEPTAEEDAEAGVAGEEAAAGEEGGEAAAESQN